ncbi:hypothetical protein ABG067_005605 [Albugo candida]
MRTSQRVWFPAMMIVWFPFDRLFVECQETFCFKLPLRGHGSVRYRELRIAEQRNSNYEILDHAPCIEHAVSHNFEFKFDSDLREFKIYSVKYTGREDHALAKQNVIRMCGMGEFEDGYCPGHEDHIDTAVDPALIEPSHYDQAH